MTVIPTLERQLAAAVRRRRRRNLRAAAIATAVTIAVAGGLLALALVDSDGSRHTPPATPKPRPQVENPPLEDVLGVFRRERTPHDKANFTMEDLIASHDRQPGESPADSRRVDLPSGPVYLWRMTDGVCTSWGNCLKTGQLAKLRVAIGIAGHDASAGRPRKLLLNALVVDGIDQIQIGPEHGNQYVVPVKSNVVEIDLTRFDPPATRILWREGGRWHRQNLPTSLP
jgi:hypothetical protein